MMEIINYREIGLGLFTLYCLPFEYISLYFIETLQIKFTTDHKGHVQCLLLLQMKVTDCLVTTGYCLSSINSL